METQNGRFQKWCRGLTPQKVRFLLKWEPPRWKPLVLLLLIAGINASPDRDRILSETYDTVCVIADLAEAGNLPEAVIRYLMLFHRLYALVHS